MKVLIVAKTRRGGGACIGGLTWEGRSVRLIAPATSEHAGLEYHVGEEWEIDSAPDPHIIPPHVENVIARSATRLRALPHLEEFIRERMPPAAGGLEVLFDGLAQVSSGGALYIAERTGLPARSTMFWVADQDLRIDSEGKRIRYRYLAPEGRRALTFVGFQEPVEVLPAGTLLRLSLAHWWRPKEQPDEELRCYLQLSGWFLGAQTASPRRVSIQIAGSQSTSDRGCHAARQTQASLPLQPGFEPIGLDQARRVLKQSFGFSDFLPTQEAVISRILSRRDTLVVMPTGGGKSLCYQLPALLFSGLTVVVSPLIALMQDQVTQLRELGLAAAFLNSTLPIQDYVQVTHEARSGAITILYAAPETLLRPETLLLLEQCRLTCLAVDEAHCISEWGHDFRPDYRQLRDVRARFPGAVCVALTATATPRVRHDIGRQLEIEPAGEFVASFNRPNLLLAAQWRQDGLGQTLSFLEQHREQAGIIYCSTRQQVNQLAAELQARRWPALPYHAGLEDKVRRENQETFIRQDAGIMVATVAFGMGINKSNVRFVLHYNLPRDLESYYQEVGRAGRDGLHADCLLLHNRGDAITIGRFIEQGAEQERPGRHARLQAMVHYAETLHCRRVPLLEYFGESMTAGCDACDNCILSRSPTEQIEATEAAQKFLSCVKRLGERFGSAHIIDVLRGSRSQRVLSRGHDRLSTYGIGREHSARDWHDLARQFTSQGLLKQDLGYGGLSLTPKGWEVLKGGKVYVTRALAPEPAAACHPSPDGHDRELFDKLRALRRDLALEAAVPSYVIFSDRALVDMATSLPRTPAHFLSVSGVGEAKLAKYGEAFLRVIRDHCEGAQPDPVSDQATPWISAKRRFQEVGELFSAGRSVAELTRQFNVVSGTIFRHLTRYLEQGGRLEPERLLASSGLSATDRTRVLAAFDQIGTERLTPVWEALGGAIAYDELHLLRIYHNCCARAAAEAPLSHTISSPAS